TSTVLITGDDITIKGYNVAADLLTANISGDGDGDITVHAENNATLNANLTAGDDLTSDIDVDADEGIAWQTAGDMQAGGNVYINGWSGVNLDGTIGDGAAAIGIDVDIESANGTVTIDGDITANDDVLVDAANNIAVGEDTAGVAIIANDDNPGSTLGNVEMRADTDSNSAGDLTMSDSSSVIGERVVLEGYNIFADLVTARNDQDADTTVITINAQDSVDMDDDVTVLSTANPSGNIDIDATLGSITQTEGALITTINGELFVDAKDGIFGTDITDVDTAIETDIAEITGRNTDTGNIDIDERDSTSPNGLIINGLTQENDGDITVDADNDITVSGTGVGVTASGNGEVDIEMTGASTIFDAFGDITINAQISTGGSSPDGTITILNSGEVNVADGSDIAINASITTVGGSIEIDTTEGRIDVDAPVTAGNLGTIDITANGDGVTPVFGNTVGILEISDNITSDLGDITLEADDNVRFDDVLSDVVSQEGDVEVTADMDDTNNGAGGEIYMLNGSLIDTGTGTITLNADERVTISQLITGNDSDTAVVVTSKNADIVDGGDSAGGVNPRTEDIIAPDGRIVLNAVTGIGSSWAIPSAGNITTALEIDADSVDAENIDTELYTVVTASGNIDLLNSWDIDVVQLVNGVLNDENPATGMITLRTIDGTITLLADDGIGPDAEGVSAIDGNIILDANETNLTDDRLSKLIINAPIRNTDTGNINLTADDNVEFGIEGDVTITDTGLFVDQLTAGDVIVEADADLDFSGAGASDAGAGGAIIMSDNNNVIITVADATVIDAGIGLIRMSADEDIIVGQLKTDHSVATEIEVILETENGAILDAGDSNDINDPSTSTSDILVDTQYGSVALIAKHGIGTDANSIETTLRDVAATTVDGDIHIRDVDVITIDGLYVVDMSGVSSYASVRPPLKGSLLPDGVTITGGMVNDNITIVAESPLTINAQVTNTGGSAGEPYEVGAGDIMLIAEGQDVNDDIILNDNVTAICANSVNCNLNGWGDITLYAGDEIAQNGDVTVHADGSGNINYHAGVDYNKGVLRVGFDNPSDTGSLDGDITMASSAVVESVTGTITMTAPDHVVLGSNLLGGVRTGGTVDITADDDTYGLADGLGAINANTHPFEDDLEIKAPTIILNAASGIGIERLPFPDVLHINGETVTGNVTSPDADINIHNAATTDTVISLIASGDGDDEDGDGSNITYDQTGGYELDLVALTFDGDINVTNEGDIVSRFVAAMDNDSMTEDPKQMILDRINELKRADGLPVLDEADIFQTITGRGDIINPIITTLVDVADNYGIVDDPFHTDPTAPQEGDVSITATNDGDITIIDVIATDIVELTAMTGDINGVTDFSGVSSTVSDWNRGEGVIDAYKAVIRTGTIGLEFTPVLNVQFLDLLLTEAIDLRSGWMLRGPRFQDQRNIEIAEWEYQNDLLAPGVVRIGNWYFENPSLNGQTNRDLSEAYYQYINNAISSFADELSLSDEAWKYRAFHEESIAVMDISLVTPLGEMGLLEKEKAKK
ncbi:MAG: hypothetical protein Q7U10_05130, partial [Thermodesulfovibrionia bacterium]|nr:hypothetical protein [Thermodesulfovibrionia bacterium]